MPEYTIQEALKELCISKATLYYRINKLKQELARHTLTRNGKKYISAKGLEILKMNSSLDSCSDSSDCPNGLNENYFDAFELLKSENEHLRGQLIEKDKQLQSKDEQILNMTRLLENSQILLKYEQEKNQLLLESSEAKKKSFWSRFKKG